MIPSPNMPHPSLSQYIDDKYNLFIIYHICDVNIDVLIIVVIIIMNYYLIIKLNKVVK
jgi:hypothetical protein